ncbi:MAG TPA: response regulator transcription factor [Actinomycetota bacterium]|nr:response regulator transcription factor [Actinomycetota bacterium]
MNILVIEDDRRLADLIARRLRTAGHTVETCDDGSRGLDRATARGLDLAIVDVMLPGMDGISLTRTLRDRDVAIPILMLTARDGIDDRVDGLRSGADDYLIKPFAFDELLARVDALARRSRGAPAGAILRHGAVTLNPRSRRVHVEGEEVELTSKEFDLLTCLLEHRGQVLTRAELKELVWDFPFDAQTKVVDLYVHYLRRKLGAGGDIIRTVRGVGYSVGR